jgi:hypothetical protein
MLKYAEAASGNDGVGHESPEGPVRHRPISSMESYVRLVSELPLLGNDKQLLLVDNAAKLFRIPASERSRAWDPP